MNWTKIITACDSEQNVLDTIVLIRVCTANAGIDVIVESYIKTHDSVGYYIFEVLTVTNFWQATDIIRNFDTLSATNFLDRQIDSENLTF